jgi:hypothetical protein
MLKTVDEVVTELGGTGAMATLARVGDSAVSNWKARGSIPSDQYMVISEALRAIGKAADPSVFSFADPEPPQNAAVQHG